MLQPPPAQLVRHPAQTRQPRCPPLGRHGGWRAGRQPQLRIAQRGEGDPAAAVQHIAAARAQALAGLQQLLFYPEQFFQHNQTLTHLQALAGLAMPLQHLATGKEIISSAHREAPSG